MSRTLRKQMLTMINLLDRANRTLKVSLKVKRINEDGIRQLLADCQETAITMGNELEMIYGEGTDLVHKLEEYHESLYRMTQVLRHPGKRYELCKQLSGQIRQVRKFLDVQIPDRLEVVFLPYKASLWDSMESSWRASQNDADCDVYVVPIPYYDRSPDGTFTKYHYEGDKMPSYVTVTHYENYDLQKRWPDTVFIQDPYDHTHSAISVDPRFYSHEVKKLTDTLVYISYLINDREQKNDHDDLHIERQSADEALPGRRELLDESLKNMRDSLNESPEDKQELPDRFSADKQELPDKSPADKQKPSDESSEDKQDTSAEKRRLCTAPGVLNADMIIVHSEEEKQFYLDAIAAEFGEEAKELWREKIFYMDIQNKNEDK